MLSLPPDAARCAAHPDRGAVRACARCGSFICAGCVVSEELCMACKRRLQAEGIPYSPDEKARSAARRSLRAATRLVRGAVVSGGLAALVVAAVSSGRVPSAMRWVGWGLGTVALVGGLVAAVLGVLGYRWSKAGRPGPAVGGVFPLATAASIVAIGLLPSLVALVLLLR